VDDDPGDVEYRDLLTLARSPLVLDEDEG
jgi:hypothetical protein